MRMLRQVSLAVLAAGLSGLSLGCDSIRLATVDTQDTVLSRRTEVVTGGGVRAEGRIDGSMLYLKTFASCDLVSMERVRRIEVREADEDLTEELVILGLSTIPLGTGIAMLADAQNVYPDDRHSRQYNAVGQEGAIIGGAILTSVGGLLAGAATIQLFRVAAAGEERETELEQRGSTIQSDVTCSGSPQHKHAAVTIVAGGSTVASLSSPGTLTVDLATVIPRPVAEREFTGTVMVQGKPVLEFDMTPVRNAQLAMASDDDEATWKAIDIERCRLAPATDDDACAPVQDYLDSFPAGAHAGEARALLSGRENATIATEPMDETTREAARRAAEATFERARQTCRQECVRQCKGKSDCAEGCVEAACPREETPPPPTQGGKR